MTSFIKPTIPERFHPDTYRVAQGYIAAAARADCDEGTNPRFSNAEIYRGSDDCAAFIEACGPLYQQAIEQPGYTPERFGHDFYMTRVGHGCGFWDRDELTVRACARVPCHGRSGEVEATPAGELGDTLAAVVCGPPRAIGMFESGGAYQYRGWLYFI